MAESGDESSGGVGISTEYKYIEVEGAGSSGANGTYKYVGMYDLEGYLNLKRPWYSKRGDWEGASYLFFIYQSEDNWYLMLNCNHNGAPTKASPGFEGSILYMSRHSGEDSAPTSGWICQNGRDPPPQVATQEEDPLQRTSLATRENDESRAVRSNDNRESSSEPNFLFDVEGAREFGANGTYKYGGNKPRFGPWYSKSGEWRDENRDFFISRYSRGWYMSVGSDGARVPWTGNTLNGRILYFSPLADVDSYNFPPTSQWRNLMFDSTTSLPRITVRKEDFPRLSLGRVSDESGLARGKKRRESSSPSGSINLNETAAATDGKKRKGSTVMVDVMALEAAKKCKQVLARQKDRLRKDMLESEARLEDMEKRKREEEQRLERLKREDIEVSRELQEADDRLSKVERSKDVISIEE